MLCFVGEGWNFGIDLNFGLNADLGSVGKCYYPDYSKLDFYLIRARIRFTRSRIPRTIRSGAQWRRAIADTHRIRPDTYTNWKY